MSSHTDNFSAGAARMSATVAYLRRCSATVPDPTRIPGEPVCRLMCAAGYTSLAKFRRHRQEWDQARRDIPRGYLAALGVDMDRLEQCVARDREAYLRRLHQPRFPRAAVAHVVAGVGLRYGFEPHTDERQAIERLRHHPTYPRAPWRIHYPWGATVLLFPDHEEQLEIHVPGFCVGRERVIWRRRERIALHKACDEHEQEA